MLRLGLCCVFVEQPIKFTRTNAKTVLRLERLEALAKISTICLANADALLLALKYCDASGIGDFRVNSQILPLRTHPKAGYRVEELPGAEQIVAGFQECGRFARDHGLRLTFHPDQFVLLSSPRSDVTQSSIAELEYQAEVAEWVGADVINIHGGGGYGDKPAALARLVKSLSQLSDAVRKRLTLENDERVYTPGDLLPLCRSEQIPLVYDVHHHRCQPDGHSVAQATELALKTWDREPLFHVSSPKDGWSKPNPSRHHDYIQPRDFPRKWLGVDCTVEVEAKAKELAVLRLARYLKRRRTSGAP